ncbi:MAG: 30S ribosomal protein S6 [Desulfobacterales bacterium]|nr:30S ribosomal protein S6 [Desulfobacterales bacterium]
MRRYETVFIVNPELSEEQRQPLFDKLNGLISGDGCMLVKFDEWGPKKLAYEIKRHARGYYVLMDFCGDGSLVREIERNMRLDDRVLKYMTVLQDTAVDIEAVKDEIEAAKEQESKSEPAEQAIGESTEKEESGLTGTVGAPASETKAPENTPETREQEEQEHGTI